jgi:hypothetical protein
MADGYQWKNRQASGGIIRATASTRIEKQFGIRNAELKGNNCQNFVRWSDVDKEQGSGKSLYMMAGRYNNVNVLSDNDFPELQDQLC